MPPERTRMAQATLFLVALPDPYPFVQIHCGPVSSVPQNLEHCNQVAEPCRDVTVTSSRHDQVVGLAHWTHEESALDAGWPCHD